MRSSRRLMYPSKKRRWPILLTFLALITIYSAWAMARPLPPLKPAFAANTLYTRPTGSKLAWPTTGQSATGILGTDIIETHGEQKPVPIASVAKVITALMVLKEKPLAKGQTGPTITLTQADVDLYHNYAAKDGSLLPVTAGEKINEYQMLQAIMLPSANNIADTMAIWAFGSLKNYSTEANKFLRQSGLTNTQVGDDASGMSPTTTSTAGDLIGLGKLAMQNEVLAEIVGQSSANLPVANTVKNVNMLLGSNGIIGIKTGNTDQAGGVFLSASKANINKQDVTILTAVAQQPDLFTALKTSNDLVKSAQTNFGPVQAITGGALVARYNIPWGGVIDAVAGDTINTINWNGDGTEVKVKATTVKPNDQTAGTITLPASPLTKQQTIPIKLQTLPSMPSAWWRLAHPLH